MKLLTTALIITLSAALLSVGLAQSGGASIEPREFAQVLWPVAVFVVFGFYLYAGTRWPKWHKRYLVAAVILLAAPLLVNFGVVTYCGEFVASYYLAMLNRVQILVVVGTAGYWAISDRSNSIEPWDDA